MTRIIEPRDMAHIVQSYLAGRSTTQLGQEYGVQPQSIRARLVKAGVKTRSVAEVKASHLPPLNMALVIDRYRQGDALNVIAKACGVDRGTIARRLVTAGVALRTQGQQEAVKWARMSPERRARQCAAAHAAARVKLAGRKPCTLSLTEKSALWQRTGCRSADEAAVSRTLTRHGFPHTPQLAIGPYNLDLALESVRISVEVVSSQVSDHYGPKLRKRTEYLINDGWRFVFVLFRGWAEKPEIGSDLVSWLEAASRDESTAGGYWMINRDGYAGTSLRRYLDGLPLIPPTGSRVEHPAD